MTKPTANEDPYTQAVVSIIPPLKGTRIPWKDGHFQAWGMQCTRGA